MNFPSVCALMIAGDPTGSRRALRSFIAQNYPEAKLAVMDLSPEVNRDFRHELEDCGVPHVYMFDKSGTPLCELRDSLIGAAVRSFKPEILVHFESFSWCHPNRIREQVFLLQHYGVPCVGYEDAVLFRRELDEIGDQIRGESWKCSPGSSALCFWRSTWELLSFRTAGQDRAWLRCVPTFVVSGLTAPSVPGEVLLGYSTRDPRMIVIGDELQLKIFGCTERAMEYDNYCLEKTR